MLELAPVLALASQRVEADGDLPVVLVQMLPLERQDLALLALRRLPVALGVAHEGEVSA
jgi:hypothetical protein